MYSGRRHKILRFFPKLPFPVPEYRGGWCRIRIEGYSVAFQLWKYQLCTKLSAEVERGAQRGGRGGLAAGGRAFGKTQGAA